MPNSNFSSAVLRGITILLWASSATISGTASASPVSIGNFVWDDLDGNGLQDPGEPGIAGVTVELVTADRTVLVDTATTNASGNYTLIGDVPGAYRIRVSLPDGHYVSQQGVGADDSDDNDVAPFGAEFRYSDPIELSPLVLSYVGFDVGLLHPMQTVGLGNFVWRDLDGDGVQDAGEPGLSGVQVELWNAEKTERLASTTTSVLGTYSLSAPRPRLVRLRVIATAGNLFAPKDAAADSIDSDVHGSGADYGFSDAFLPPACCGGSLSDWDVGLMLPANPVLIGNLVWQDLDGDGLRDVGEPGLSGVVVQLWNAEQTEILDTDVTSASGVYSVTGAVPGSFRIRVLAPDGYQYAQANVGGDDTIDSDVDGTTSNVGFSEAFNAGSNVISISKYDAGLVLPTHAAVIGNYAWFDADYDGVQEAGESPVAGLKVELWDPSKTQLIASDTTSVSGNFTLEALVPGGYRLRVPIAAGSGVQFTRKNAGADSTKDSEIHPWGPEFRFTDVLYLQSNLISTSTQDVGMLQQVIPEPAVALASGVAALALAGLRHSRRGR